jgi:Rrf2 family transcriptional regulator, iron-sulfur cluster assembly transcription factor
MLSVFWEQRLPLLARRQILAIAVVTDIAINARDEPARTRDVASRLNLPKPRYIEPLLQALTNKGILTITRGAHGGYRLARKPLLISVDDIVRAVTDTDGMTESKSHSVIEREIVYLALRRVEGALTEALQRLTIDVLMRQARG